MACAPDQPSKFEKPNTDQELKCPICLEALKTPRSLACLHTFCEGCITSCVLEAVGKGVLTSSIQCPICRTDTVLATTSKPHVEWARTLPLNDAIVPMLKSTESESRKLCDRCRKRNQENLAKLFCVDCNDFQCTACVDSHKGFSAIENHKMIGLDDIAEQHFDLGITQYCQYHAGKKFKFFCADHDICCCTTCAIIEHRTCKTLTEIKKLGKDLKQGGQLQLVVTEMATFKMQVHEMTKTFEDFLSSIVDEPNPIPNKIRDIQTKLVQVFDQLVSDVTSKFEQLKKQETTELEDKITTLRSLEAAITATHPVLETLEKYGTETQLFMTLRLFQKQAKQYQQRIDDTCRTLTTKGLKLCFSKELNSLISCTEALATVDLDQTKLFTPISECDIKISPSVSVDTPTYIGAQCISNGRLLVIDYYNKLCCIMDENFSIIPQVYLSFTSRPRDVTLMGPSEAVAVLEDSRELQRVSVGTTLTLNGTIPCTRTPRCLSHISDTELAVGWEVGLGIIHLDGTEKFYMDQDTSGRQIKFSIYCRLVVNTVASHFYQSSRTDDKVYGMKMTGKPLFAYTMEHPRGIALDRDRNICVCSRNSSSVHQISPDGQCIRIIELDIDNVLTIVFNPKGTEMTVMSGSLVDNKAIRAKFLPKD